MVSPLEIPEDVDTVLLDVGNVLVSDYWESLLLTPGLGLADVMHLDRALVKKVGVSLWEEFCRAPSEEEVYWDRLSEALEVRIADAVRRQLEHLPMANPRNTEIFASLEARGAKVGLITDNTAFWFPKQAELIGFGQRLDSELVLLSYERGVSKSDSPGLIEFAAKVVPPGRTLMVDDRATNLSVADRLGFHTFLYSMQDDETVKPSTPSPT